MLLTELELELLYILSSRSSSADKTCLKAHGQYLKLESVVAKKKEEEEKKANLFNRVMQNEGMTNR